MKRLVGWLLVLVLLGVPLALGTAAYLCFEDQPLVRRAAELKAEDVERATRLVEKHDPLVDIEAKLAADLTFGNFETTITRKLPNNGGPHDGKGNKRFVTLPERAAILTFAAS